MASDFDSPNGHFENVHHKNLFSDPTFIGVTVAVIVSIITILFLIARSRKPRRRTILITGISDGGKTLLFSKLMYNRYIESYTSIKENTGLYWVKTKKLAVPILDIPGNDRQRLHFWDRFKKQTRALIFVIDSSMIQKEVKEVAEYLYNLLIDSNFPKSRTSRTHLLIACNKQDITTAKSSRVVQSQLEKEINTLRVTRKATLDSTDSSGKSSEVILGKKGKSFEFGQLSTKVEFVECSAKGTDDSSEGIQLVIDWINKVAK